MSLKVGSETLSIGSLQSRRVGIGKKQNLNHIHRRGQSMFLDPFDLELKKSDHGPAT